MNLKKRYIHEKRLLCFGLLLNERHTTLCDLLVAEVLGFLVQDAGGLHRLALHAFPPLRLGITKLAE